MVEIQYLGLKHTTRVLWSGEPRKQYRKSSADLLIYSSPSSFACMDLLFITVIINLSV